MIWFMFCMHRIHVVCEDNSWFMKLQVLSSSTSDVYAYEERERNSVNDKCFKNDQLNRRKFTYFSMCKSLMILTTLIRQGGNKKYIWNMHKTQHEDTEVFIEQDKSLS